MSFFTDRNCDVQFVNDKRKRVVLEKAEGGRGEHFLSSWMGIITMIINQTLDTRSRSLKQSHKRDGMGVRRIRTFPFLPTPLTTPSLTFRL